MLGISSEATIKVYTWICLGFRIAPPHEFFFVGATIKVYAGISSEATIKVYTYNLRKKGGGVQTVYTYNFRKKGGVRTPWTPPPGSAYEPSPDLTYPAYVVGDFDRNSENTRVVAVTGQRSGTTQLEDLLRRPVAGGACSGKAVTATGDRGTESSTSGCESSGAD